MQFETLSSHDRKHLIQDFVECEHFAAAQIKRLANRLRFGERLDETSRDVTHGNRLKPAPPIAHYGQHR